MPPHGAWERAQLAAFQLIVHFRTMQSPRKTYNGFGLSIIHVAYVVASRRRSFGCEATSFYQ